MELDLDMFVVAHINLSVSLPVSNTNVDSHDKKKHNSTVFGLNVPLDEIIPESKQTPAEQQAAKAKRDKADKLRQPEKQAASQHQKPPVYQLQICLGLEDCNLSWSI